MGRRCVQQRKSQSLTMKTLEWLFSYTFKAGKILAVIFVMVFIIELIIPKGYIAWFMNKLAFSELRLPAPRKTPVSIMTAGTVPDDFLKRTDFAQMIQTINLVPGQTIKEGMTVFGYARTDLFDKENGTMWVVVRRRDGVPVATTLAYTQYYNGGYGYIPFSLKVPLLLIKGECLLEFRKQPLDAHNLKDILFTSMPVTCVMK